MNAIIETALEQLKPILAEAYADAALGNKLVELQEKGIDTSEIKAQFQNSFSNSKSFIKGLKGLGDKISLLFEATVDFATRLATIPLAIIGMGTTGPTISINLILPLIKQLQGEGRNLAQIYEEVETGLDSFQIPSLAENNSTINGIYATLTGILSVAAGLVALVGIKCGDQEAKDTSEYEKSPMPVDATVCTNYLPVQEHQEDPKESTWCTKFEDIMGKTPDDFEDDEDGTKEEKYEAWRKENAKTLEDFEDTEEETKEEQYIAWLREHRVCRNCKNFKK